MIARHFQKIRDTFRAINCATSDIRQMRQALMQSELDRLRAQRRYSDPKHLVPHGAKVYSQCDEDGIIAEIFRRIGTTNKCFVEFGIGDGLENNTHTLLFDGWHGVWIDASSESVRDITSAYSKIIGTGKLKVVESFITANNIDGLIRQNVEHSEIDLLSVDVDGNDYYVFNAIACVSARVIAIEYNAKFPPPLLFCMDYDEAHYWRGGDTFGASLKFLEVNLRDKGYSLVGCNLSGSNAFFVRNDLVSDRFLEPFTAENHYEPSRYYLSELASGQQPSFDTLVKSFAMRQQSS